MNGKSENPSEEDIFKRTRQLNAAGFKLMEEDKADLERGPIVRLVHAVFHAAYEKYGDKDSPFGDLSLFQKSFVTHFGDTEALQYRLYHLIIGSSPPGNTNLFDAEGEWSIAEKMRELAKKYHIDIEKV